MFHIVFITVCIFNQLSVTLWHENGWSEESISTNTPFKGKVLPESVTRFVWNFSQIWSDLFWNDYTVSLKASFVTRAPEHILNPQRWRGGSSALGQRSGLWAHSMTLQEPCNMQSPHQCIAVWDSNCFVLTRRFYNPWLTAALFDWGRLQLLHQMKWSVGWKMNFFFHALVCWLDDLHSVKNLEKAPRIHKQRLNYQLTFFNNKIIQHF